MRKRPVGAGCDDRREGRLGAELAEPGLGGSGHIALGAPGEAALERPAVDVVGELGGGGDPLELLGLLHSAKLLDQVTGGNELDALARRGLQPGKLANAQLGVLEADTARHPPDDLRDELALGLGPLPLGPDLMRGALGVAEVGEEDQLFRADQASTVGAGEAGQIADIHQVRDEELVELALGDQRGEALASAHTSSRSAISSSASR